MFKVRDVSQVPLGILPDILLELRATMYASVSCTRACAMVFSITDNRQDTPPVRVRTLLLWSLTGNAVCFSNTVWGTVRRQNAQGAPCSQKIRGMLVHVCIPRSSVQSDS